MKKIAIVVEKNQGAGAVGNICAVLLGQTSLVVPELFSLEPLFDLSGTRHTGIRISTVILKAGQGQLMNFVNQVMALEQKIVSIVFSEIGQGLNNRFPEYQELIKNSSTEDSKIVGIILVGEKEVIEPLTKKFSVF
jgi:hypothetical protein